MVDGGTGKIDQGRNGCGLAIDGRRVATHRGALTETRSGIPVLNSRLPPFKVPVFRPSCRYRFVTHISEPLFLLAGTNRAQFFGKNTVGVQEQRKKK
jgi:hypothetical protein